LNIITKIGLWIEKRFPERINAEFVMVHFSERQREVKDLMERVHALELRFGQIEILFKDAESFFHRMEDDIRTLKTQSTFKNKATLPVPDNMTPFASRAAAGNQMLRPVNGGA
jgi:tRNA nucleotidyltransferase/poly(A) polymerase